MRLELDVPQPIEKLRKVYNDKAVFITSTKNYPLVDAIEFTGDYLSVMRKREVPVKVGKQIDKLSRRYEKRLRAIWQEHNGAILAACKAPATEVEKADAPTLAQVLAEPDPSRQAVLRQRYLKARRDELIRPKIESMKDDLKRAAVPIFAAAFLLGKQRGQILTNQELDDTLTREDQELLAEKKEWNDAFIDKLSDDNYEAYQETLEETYEDDAAFLAAFGKAQEKNDHRLASFAAVAGSVLLAVGMAQATRDVQEIDPDTGEPTGEPKIDPDTGAPIGDVVDGGIWHTSHDENVCDGCEEQDGRWMRVEEFETEAGTNECLTRCRCIELFEVSPRTEEDENEEKVTKAVAPVAKASEGVEEKTIAVDLNGTILAASGPRSVAEFGQPNPGAKEVLERLRLEGYTIIIHSVWGNKKEIADYLASYEIPYDHINWNPKQPVGTNIGKPLAEAYIDDRAIHFNGNWEAVYAEIHRRRAEKFAKGEWTEELHPRDEKGRFGEGGTVEALHGTTEFRFRGIVREGIKAGKYRNFQANLYEGDRASRVFVTTKPKVAELFAREAAGSSQANPVVITLRIPKDYFTQNGEADAMAPNSYTLPEVKPEWIVAADPVYKEEDDSYTIVYLPIPAALYEELTGKSVEKAWTEELHPRDESGKFSEGGATPSTVSDVARGMITSAERKVMDQGLLHGTEMAVIINNETGESVEKMGGEDHVDLKKELNDLDLTQRYTLIHNHPSSGSFSPSDIAILWSDSRITRLEVKGNNGTKYTLEKTKDSFPGVGNPQDIRLLWGEHKSRLDSTFIPKYRENPTPENEKVLWQEHTHQIMEKYAADMNLVYTRERPDAR